MKKYILYPLLFIFFACTDESRNQAEAKRQQQLDSLKLTADKLIQAVRNSDKTFIDSLRKSRLAIWKKQATLMAVNLDADRATVFKARQMKLSERRTRDLKQATLWLNKDKARYWQIKDSIRKYGQ